MVPGSGLDWWRSRYREIHFAVTSSQQLAAIGGKVLYVSGEESAEQIKLRAERLGSINTEFYLYAETDMNEISRAIEHISLIMLSLIPSKR